MASLHQRAVAVARAQKNRRDGQSRTEAGSEPRSPGDQEQEEEEDEQEPDDFDPDEDLDGEELSGMEHEHDHEREAEEGEEEEQEPQSDLGRYCNLARKPLPKPTVFTRP